MGIGERERLLWPKIAHIIAHGVVPSDAIAA